jgi:hypothetical protein
LGALTPSIADDRVKIVAKWENSALQNHKDFTKVQFDVIMSAVELSRYHRCPPTASRYI